VTGANEFDNVTIRNKANISLLTGSRLTNLTILSGGVLSHTAGNNIALTISNNMVIDAGGSINVNGKGYAAASGLGKGGSSGSLTYKGGGGAGYGGNGGSGTGDTATGGTAYGSLTAPIDLGSGGGNGSSGSGGAGGGAIRLDVSGTLTVNGTIYANGAAGSISGGGGSGGSIYITANSLIGNGIISANGGNGGTSNPAYGYGGGGGGGRIAIYRNTATEFTGNIVVSGGTGNAKGENGTIHQSGLITATEQTYSQSNLAETLMEQTHAINDVAATGDLSGTFAFTDFKMVSVKTGSFANKGFFTAEWQANLEGIDYTGGWQGILFLNQAENRIHLKGKTYGGIAGIVEGYLTESVAGSGIYDQFQIGLQVSQAGAKTVSGTINLIGTATYQAIQEYPSTQLYVLQTSLVGTSSVDYSGSLDIVITHLRVADNNNPYYGQGFSVISHTSAIGAGAGYTYDRLVSEGQVALSGMFNSPLLGIVSGVLNESTSPRTLSFTLERVDLGAPPAADLKVRVWGPQRVSPGQSVTYTIEYRNDGLKAATDAVVFDYLDFLVKHKSASTGAYYNSYSHRVSWDLGALPPKSHGYLTIQTEVIWGLPQGLTLENIAYIEDMVTHSDEDGIFLNGISYDPDDKGDTTEKNAFADAANLRWVPVYQETGNIDGGLHALCASQNVPTDKNGLGTEQLEEIRGSNEGSYEICAGHSGGPTILVELAKQGLIKGKELVLISPQLITEEELEAITGMYEEDPEGNPISGFKKITVFQGDDLIPPWANSWAGGLANGIDSDENGYLDESELRWLMLGNIGELKEIIKKLETAEGKEFKGLEIDPEAPGINLTILWQDGTVTEMRATPDIDEDGDGDG
ncbi:MAG: DUF11 domain-containing protein, partial [Dehalococcoidia bacterium]|nr:DUF11 domain-containing protein [Dehalococcoidia bacterium]